MVNQINTPSFGRLYVGSTSKIANEALSKYVDVVKNQKSLISKLDKMDYDVFVLMREQAHNTIGAKKIFRIEVRKKLMPPFNEDLTDLLRLKNNEMATRAFVLGPSLKNDMQQYLTKIKNAIS